MKKILIIGQAPPAQKQEVPYDTTMLYEILGWCDIGKEQAQEMFIFDACTDKFPGYSSSGSHLPPTKENFSDYLNRGLRQRIQDADKVLLLGKVAYNLVMDQQNELELAFKTVLCLPHPSIRNKGRILQHKEDITTKLKKFLLVNY